MLPGNASQLRDYVNSLLGEKENTEPAPKKSTPDRLPQPQNPPRTPGHKPYSSGFPIGCDEEITEVI